MHDLVTRTVVVDANTAMLNLCAEAIRAGQRSVPSKQIRLLHGDWMALPSGVQALELVVGDNSLNFLSYPDDWDALLATLRDRMNPGAVFLTRLLAVPPDYRRLCPANIVANAQTRAGRINFTAVRVALLFSAWNPATCTIRPEDALETFEEHRSEFDALLGDVRAASRNDLLSIEKYRGSDAVYGVPRLSDAIAIVQRHFQVRAVCFGPYDMSEYFPLIVAHKR